MIRHAFLAAASVAVVALFQPGCSDDGRLDLADYDVGCSDASDCSAVYIGDCSADLCPNAAINSADLAKYQGDFNAQDCEFSPDCSARPSVTCKAGKCAVGK